MGSFNAARNITNDDIDISTNVAIFHFFTSMMENSLSGNRDKKI